MKQNLISLILFFIAITVSAQDVSYNFDSKIEVKKKEKQVESPYSMFGDNTAVLQTKHEEAKDHSLKIPILEDEHREGLFKLDFQTGIVSMTDKAGRILFQEQLDKEASARFTSIDPMAEKYYSISPYVYCANNPLKYTDPNGDTIRIRIYDAANQTINSYYYGADANGDYGFIGANGALYSGNDAFAGSLTTALGKLREKGAGRALVDDLASSTNIVTIETSTKNAAYTNTNEIAWNDANTNPYSPRPGFVGLAHEMGHIQDSWNGTLDNSPWPGAGDPRITNSEKYATHLENQVRSEHGIGLRTHYSWSTDGRPNDATRIINATTSASLFYTQPQTHNTTRIVYGVPVTTSTIVPVPFVYRGY